MSDRKNQAFVTKLSMSRFYIKLDAPYPVDDEEGELYADVESARTDAISFLADLLKDRRREITPGEAWRVSILDDQANLVCTLNFSVDGP